jgi:hypothetical protein
LDGQGRSVFSQKIAPGSGDLRLDLPELPGGIYFLYLIPPDGDLLMLGKVVLR